MKGKAPFRRFATGSALPIGHSVVAAATVTPNDIRCDLFPIARMSRACFTAALGRCAPSQTCEWRDNEATSAQLLVDSQMAFGMRRETMSRMTL